MGGRARVAVVGDAVGGVGGRVAAHGREGAGVGVGEEAEHEVEREEEDGVVGFRGDEGGHDVLFWSGRFLGRSMEVGFCCRFFGYKG